MFLSVFIFTANGFVLICGHRLKHHVQRRLILNLLGIISIDLVIGLSCASTLVVSMISSLKRDYRACAFLIFSMEFGVTTSLLHTLIICLERFLAVYSKTRKPPMKTRERIIQIMLSWIVIGLIFGGAKIDIQTDIPFCSIETLYGKYFDLYIKVFALVILLPLLIATVTVYGITILVLKIRLKQIGPLVTTDHAKLTRVSSLSVDQLFASTSSSTSQINTEGPDRCCQENNKLQVPSGPNNRLQIQTIDPSTSAPFQLKKSRQEKKPVASCSHISHSYHNEDIQRIGNKASVNSPFHNGNNLGNNKLNLKREPSDDSVSCRETSFFGRKTNRFFGSQGMRSTRRGYQAKAIRTIGIIVLVLSLTTGVGVLLFTVDSLCTQCQIARNFRHIAMVLWFLNSVLNPCIYFFSVQDIRSKIKGFFQCHRV